MFGYLNKGNPRLIGETEAQEIKNASIENGYLEYAEYPVNSLNLRRLTLPNGKIVELEEVSTPLGQLKWRDSSGSLYQIGLDAPNNIVINNDPWTTTSRMPVGSVVAHGSNPYPPGTYEYAVTLYDPDTGEESIPATGTFVISTNQIARHADFPDVSDLFPGRTNLQWRIYRRPQGGSEFLLVNGSTTISANSDYAGPYDDTIEDQNLGEACDSIDDGVSFLRTKYSAGAILFNDHMFVFGTQGELSRVNFSRQGKWWAFTTENELNLPGRFRGACVLNENLVLFSTEGVFVLYGDNADNFALKQIEIDLTGDDNQGIVFSSPRSTCGLAFFAINKELTFEGESGMAAYQIAAFDGGKAKDISVKIKDLFPLGDLSTTELMQSAIIENRFYALKMLDLDASLAVAVAAGRTWATVVDSDKRYTTLVFDANNYGWLNADDSGVFTYRTKEFALPRNVQFHKRIWVEAEGTFTLQFMGDNQVVTELTLTHATKTKAYYNVRPYRYDSFSFRFVGSEGCKIYDFGVDE